MDESLFLFINISLQNAVFDSLMPFITNRNHLLFIAVLIPLFSRDWRKGLLILALCASGFIVADITSGLLKNIFARPRPHEAIENVRLLVPRLGSFSFPSGHASTSFTIAFIIAYHFRRAAVPAFIIAALVAFSRIYVGVHYPSDVIAGAAVGVITGGGIILIQKKAKWYLSL